MRIHLLSDLHLEVSPYVPAATDANVVILAGDIHTKARGVRWALDNFSGAVLYVPGNHEFYSGHLTYTLVTMRSAARDGRVQVMNMHEAVIGGVRFLGCTMWTDYAALVQESIKTRSWLRSKLDEPFDGKTVVITHRAPSLRSLADSPDAGTLLDAAYANDCEDLLGGERVALWLHGHSHFAVDYEIRGTRVVCNPRGYPSEETGFDPKLVLTI
ncbi:metallophosphoesterase family protein [Stutzerimonas stutzeri]|jgi:Icc-related predicted phosphoesterase|uniref:Icc-related predicted phosphoesterase n=1 Tax=Stutzerimonas stutzeri TaxID=316 RepID=A0A5S5BFY6_STUST|nr:metallophosphoesterase family protein [Stutzerimonas stutzeri]TYP65328.1 Icc-related predicted phosphoesterase [Stutzerimonas stutzeri]